MSDHEGQYLYKTIFDRVVTLMKPIKTIPERFLEKISITKSCWYWLGAINPKGYGTFFVDKNNRMSAHRFSWQFFFGKIGNDNVIDHVCREKECVNPDHLSKIPYHQHIEIHKSGRLSLLAIQQHLYKTGIRTL